METEKTRKRQEKLLSLERSIKKKRERISRVEARIKKKEERREKIKRRLLEPKRDCHILQLPNEILLPIFAQLDGKSLARVALTCRRFFLLVRDYIRSSFKYSLCTCLKTSTEMPPQDEGFIEDYFRMQPFLKNETCCLALDMRKRITYRIPKNLRILVLWKGRDQKKVAAENPSILHLYQNRKTDHGHHDIEFTKNVEKTKLVDLTGCCLEWDFLQKFNGLQSVFLVNCNITICRKGKRILEIPRKLKNLYLIGTPVDYIVGEEVDTFFYSNRFKFESKNICNYNRNPLNREDTRMYNYMKQKTRMSLYIQVPDNLEGFSLISQLGIIEWTTRKHTDFSKVLQEFTRKIYFLGIRISDSPIPNTDRDPGDPPKKRTFEILSWKFENHRRPKTIKF